MRSRTMRRVAARYTWDRVKVSLWFVPFVMAVTAVVLTRLLFNLDRRIPNELLNNSQFIYTATAF